MSGTLTSFYTRSSKIRASMLKKMNESEMQMTQNSICPWMNNVWWSLRSWGEITQINRLCKHWRWLYHLHVFFYMSLNVGILLISIKILHPNPNFPLHMPKTSKMWCGVLLVMVFALSTMTIKFPKLFFCSPYSLTCVKQPFQPMNGENRMSITYYMVELQK